MENDTHLLAALSADQARLEAQFPGPRAERQPVQVIYGGAHLFSKETPAKLGALARAAFERYLPDPSALTEVFGLSASLAARVFPRVAAKLSSEPVEDLRIDFEDGYGERSDSEEDGHAASAGAAHRAARDAKALPPFSGLRLKPLTPRRAERAIRTLRLFLDEAGPHGLLTVTIPKVESVTHVRVACDLLEAEERRTKREPGSLRLELMIEAGNGLLDGEGRALLPQLRHAAGARLFGAHFGAYDFLSSLEVAAHAQSLRHPFCDVARAQLALAFAQTGVFVSDGATTQLPVAPHRGTSLTSEQELENRRVMHTAWQLAAADIRHALVSGFFQGWDLHPAQLVSRYVTLSAFFLENLAQMQERLSHFRARLGQATRVGTTFDDAATIRGLEAFFRRGRSCGALTEAECAP